jgi:hypothetical protein
MHYPLQPRFWHIFLGALLLLSGCVSNSSDMSVSGGTETKPMAPNGIENTVENTGSSAGNNSNIITTSPCICQASCVGTTYRYDEDNVCDASGNCQFISIPNAEVCLTIQCKWFQKYIDGECADKTCEELNGTYCDSDDYCMGEWGPPNCCIGGSCVTTQEEPTTASNSNEPPANDESPISEVETLTFTPANPTIQLETKSIQLKLVGFQHVFDCSSGILNPMCIVATFTTTFPSDSNGNMINVQLRSSTDPPVDSDNSPYYFVVQDESGTVYKTYYNTSCQGSNSNNPTFYDNAGLSQTKSLCFVISNFPSTSNTLIFPISVGFHEYQLGVIGTTFLGTEFRDFSLEIE